MAEFKLGDRVEFREWCFGWGRGWARGTVCHTGIDPRLGVRRDGTKGLGVQCYVEDVRPLSAIEQLGELADG